MEGCILEITADSALRYVAVLTVATLSVGEGRFRPSLRWSLVLNAPLWFESRSCPGSDRIEIRPRGIVNSQALSKDACAMSIEH